MSVAAPSFTDQADISRNRLILVVYTLAIFVSALLCYVLSSWLTRAGIGYFTFPFNLGTWLMLLLCRSTERSI